MAAHTFFVGHLKGVGKVYQQSAIDCCCRLAWGRFYTNRMPVTAVHLLNTDVLPASEAQGVPIKTMLSDDGREFCSRPDRYPYELFLQLEGIESHKTRVTRPQSNGIVERLRRTLLDEHFRVEGRRTSLETGDEMQAALDAYLVTYNTERPHQGRGMSGRTSGAPSSTAFPRTTTSRRTSTGKLTQPDLRRAQHLSAEYRLSTSRLCAVHHSLPSVCLLQSVDDKTPWNARIQLNRHSLVCSSHTSSDSSALRPLTFISLPI